MLFAVITHHAYVLAPVCGGGGRVVTHSKIVSIRVEYRKIRRFRPLNIVQGGPHKLSQFLEKKIGDPLLKQLKCFDI